MQLSRVLTLLAAAGGASAAVSVIIGDEICLTSYGSVPVAHVPTHTVRDTIRLTLFTTKTKFPVQTVTPTITVTSETIEIDTITLAQNTDTVTNIALATVTSTLEVDVSQTDTVTSTFTTTEPPTVTAATATNYTPFASEAAVIAAGGGSQNQKREMHVPRRGLDSLAGRSPNIKKLTKQSSKNTCPQSVRCVVHVEDIVYKTKTVTAKTTKTHSALPSIATDTETDTITSTVVPGDATATVTSTSTATSLTVSVNIHDTTVTSVSTATEFAGPAVTYYPQCQSDNLITYVGGQPLYYLSTTNYQYLPGVDAVTCCQTCAVTADCAGFAGPQPGFSDCYILLDAGTCDASVPSWTVYLAAGQSSDFDVVGNGNCGQGTYGGNV